MARILVVEDEGLVLLLTEGILKEAGHETFTATDVTEAQSLMDSQPAFDLLFTDIHLKSEEHGGLQLAQLLLQRQPGARVLYTTGGIVTDGMKALFVDGATVLADTPQQLVAAAARTLNNEVEDA